MLNIIYQDESIVVCEKPFRVLSTDEPGGMPDLIREAIGQPEAKVRTVHRLDQVVGGIMVYALTGPAASELSRQIREDSFLKEYQAVVHWRPQYDEGTYIDLLGRNEKTRKTYVAKYPGKGIQQAAPVDSFVTPLPWDMPGYNDKVIMAAGAFIQGSSIELSADGPIRPPYAVYFQGGLTWYHAKLGILLSLQKLVDAGLVSI